MGNLKDLIKNTSFWYDRRQHSRSHTPTSADKDAFEALSKSGMVNAETHPNTFAWFALVSKFSDKVKATWAAGGGAAAADKGGKGKGKGGKGGKKEEKKKEE